VTATRLRPLLAGACLLACAQAMAEAPVVRQDAGGRPDLETRLTRVERVVGGQGLLDLLSQVERLNRELKQLRGAVDDHERSAVETNQRADALGYAQLHDRRRQGGI